MQWKVDRKTYILTSILNIQYIVTLCTMEERMKCCLCNGKMYWDTGHNAMPLKDGRCCDRCNGTKVLPERIRGFAQSK